MNPKAGDLFEPPFEVLAPARQSAPCIFNSPHSGRVYPQAFLLGSRLDPLVLRRSEDAYVDELFAGVVDLGAPLLRAHFPRAYLDVNREPYELDPQMFSAGLPAWVNTTSVRVAGGLGTIPRVVSEHEEIYRAKLSFAEAETRIRNLYRPYHSLLGRLLNETSDAFGTALLIDCHSMPSTALGPSDGSARKPDLVLGDRHGSSCAEHVARRLETLFRDEGFRVTRNKPYAGGFITQAWGRPLEGLHALQIEINRALYMNERTIERGVGFGGLKRALAAVLRRFLGEARDLLVPARHAAE